MRITTIILFILILGFLLYTIGALTVQKDRITITTAVVAEKAKRAADSAASNPEINSIGCRLMGLFDRFKISITSKATE